jgi:peptidoglycan/xylan/chitin deacetylase (PgdA/CDA1 family)
MRSRAAVLCFHDVVPAARLDDLPVTHRPYAIDPEDFRAYLMAVQSSGRRAVPVTSLATDLSGGTVSITFDDGWASDYEEAFPALRELHMRATFFVVPTLVGTPGYVTWGQLREMVAAGMEVASHSMTHPFMHRLDRAGLEREFGESKTIIEQRLGHPVRAASLPRGWEPPDFQPVLRDLGYRVFCTSRIGWWYPGASTLAMPRVPVRRGLAVDDIGAIAAGEARALWRMQSVELVKNAVKRCLGAGGWQRLRAPLLSLRERV